MDTDFGKLDRDVRALIEELAGSIPADELRGMRLASQAGEWTEAIEHLCATLVLDRIPITSAYRDALAALLDTFGPQDDFYKYVNHRAAATIAALNVE